jgi:ABC-type glycerol-3-phosphate transport system substrate-binding protein
MKKIIILVLALIMALSLLTACGSNDNGGTGSTGGNDSAPPASQGGNNNGGAAKEWPSDKFTAEIPKPESGILTYIDTREMTGTYSMDWTKEEMLAYVEQVKAAGWTGYASESGEGSSYVYSANQGTGTDKLITIMSNMIQVSFF